MIWGGEWESLQVWCVPIPSKVCEELTLTQDSVKPEGCVLCKLSQLQVHWEYSEKLVEGFAWGGVKGSGYDFDCFILYCLELLN